MQCLIKLESSERSEAKMDLVMRTNELMPAGKPNFLSVPKYPAIAKLVETEGKKKMLMVMILLVKDFCSSMNVVRNMNEDQMIEAGSVLLDECDNFRLEDYVMMFSMAKKGQLPVKVYDRIDIQLISQFMDAYWVQRNNAGNDANEEEYRKTEEATGSYVFGEWADSTIRGQGPVESIATLTAKLAMSQNKK